jgi:hypothetical protein
LINFEAIIIYSNGEKTLVYCFPTKKHKRYSYVLVGYSEVAYSKHLFAYDIKFLEERN